MKKILNKLKAKIRGTLDLDRLCKDGFIHGKNFDAMEGVIIDPGHCWLIKVGDNVTLAPRVHILAHDASMKKMIGYTRIGKVEIGNNVFVGANSIILPGVKVGDNVIIGAGSIVSHDCESNGIYVGNPAKKIAEFNTWINRKKDKVKDGPVFSEKYIYGNINKKLKEEMIEKLNDGDGYII